MHTIYYTCYENFAKKNNKNKKKELLSSDIVKFLEVDEQSDALSLSEAVDEVDETRYTSRIIGKSINGWNGGVQEEQASHPMKTIRDA